MAKTDAERQAAYGRATSDGERIMVRAVSAKTSKRRTSAGDRKSVV